MGMHRHRQHRVDFMEWAPEELPCKCSLLFCGW
uniref:Sbe3 n=1 Tax=Arundo donax TaxID=35708 RepID=A0A0A9DV10_ARUDO